MEIKIVFTNTHYFKFFSILRIIMFYLYSILQISTYVVNIFEERKYLMSGYILCTQKNMVLHATRIEVDIPIPDSFLYASSRNEYDFFNINKETKLKRISRTLRTFF